MRRKRRLFDRALAATLPLVPRPIVRKVAGRYVAGETLEEAIARVETLASWGAMATIDVLGEEIRGIEEGEAPKDAYLQVLEAIRSRRLTANVSVKLTAFGLKLDKEVCYRRVRELVVRARELSNFVRIDMEDRTCTSDTIEIYRRLRKEGLDNCGLVIQAYMRRSLEDVRSLAELRPSYRLCKGIYVEPESVAYQDGLEINRNYEALLAAMIDAGSYVGIATHDHALAESAMAFVRERGLAPDRYEFQMLLGVDEALGRRILAAGHRLRIYVPFGGDWYAYCIRRLKENPKIGRYVFLAMFKRG